MGARLRRHRLRSQDADWPDCDRPLSVARSGREQSVAGGVPANQRAPVSISRTLAVLTVQPGTESVRLT